VALIDLDGFKGINDTYGHEAGDALICAVADRLSEVIRPVDTAGRVGGDEFILLLDGADAPAATALCRRARAAIARPVQLPTAEVTIGASIGVAIYPTDGDDIEALLRSADHAMYAIKTRGGGVLLYDRERHTAAA
jgi:diguanylate cyclase (GGDEF)-like protein